MPYSRVQFAALAGAVSVSMIATVAIVSLPEADAATPVEAGLAAVTTPASGVPHASVREAMFAVSPSKRPSLNKMLGQRIMIGFVGKSASSSVLARVRAGQVGSIILMGENVSSLAQLQRLTSQLQRAARQGGNPPLLIATDQEGPGVKRLPWAAPFSSPGSMTRSGNPRVAYLSGRASAAALRKAGINWNLAPVADVPGPGSFLANQGRTFSANPRAVAIFAGAFAAGTQSAHVAATAKHFPGLGSGRVNTDLHRSVIRSTKVERAAALVPYRKLIASGIDAVMLSNAIYPAYEPHQRPAGLSGAIVQGLLRRHLGFTGVTVTDSLEAPLGMSRLRAGVAAAAAGSDVLLYTGSGSGVHPALIKAAHRGQLSMASIEQSYDRILELKRKLV